METEKGKVEEVREGRQLALVPSTCWLGSSQRAPSGWGVLSVGVYDGTRTLHPIGHEWHTIKPVAALYRTQARIAQATPHAEYGTRT
ncbi:Cytochrome c oxidase assembly protein COX11 [Fusarium oxysporum f. sp. albedinis]|nr:Cytochrome c oxidase assembly protein COX11 [Fusarium oxysporum f. sp. albedinis]